MIKWLISNSYLNGVNADPSKLITTYLGDDSVLVECALTVPGL